MQGTEANQRGDYNTAITDFTRVIASNSGRAQPYYRRGFAYYQKRDYSHAIADFGEAIQLRPSLVRAYIFRGDAYGNQGDYAKAAADFSQAIQIDSTTDYAHNQIDISAYAHNNLAWILATSPQADVRDGPRAVEQATSSCEATKWKNPISISTLAATCAEAGNFSTAVKWETQFLQTPGLSLEEMTSGRKLLSLYQGHQADHTEGAVVDENAFALATSKALIRDYVSAESEEETGKRDSILKLTPIGSSPQEVLKVIQADLHGSVSPDGYKKNYYSGLPGSNQLIYISGNIGTLLDTHLGSLIWPVRTDVVVNWYFDTDDRLFNVTVKKQFSGL